MRLTRTPVNTTVWHPWRNLAGLIWRFFTSMELAIVLLVALALACIAGSFIPQETLVPLGEIQGKLGNAYPYMAAMGLLNLFYSNWFLALLALFFVSVTFGSFRWLKPAWNSIRRTTLYSAEYLNASERVQHCEISPAIPPPEMLEALRQGLYNQGFTVSHTSPTHPWSLFAQRGTLGRVGPMVTHLGISLTLLAALYGAFTNFTAQELTEPGSTFTLATAEGFRTSTQPPYWYGKVPEWRVRVQAFNIEFQPKAPTVPRQFATHLTLEDPKTGQILARGITEVNKPFRYNNVTFYQAQFAPTTRHLVTINNTPVVIDANQTLAGRPYAIHSLSPQKRLFFFPLGRFTDGLPQNRLHVLMEENGQLLGYQQGFDPKNKNMLSIQEGVPRQTFAGNTIAYDKAIMATGLQIKYAPELWFLYASLALLALGCIMSLIPHHQVWLALHSPEAHENAHDAPPTQLVYLAKARKRPMALQRSLEKAFSLLAPPVYLRHHHRVEPAPPLTPTPL
jgi:cytochrome c biogenesis protein